MVFGLFKRKKSKAAKKKRPAAKRKATKKAVKRPKGKAPKKQAPKATVLKLKGVTTEAKIVGKVTHYFPHVKAAVVDIKAGEVNIGDTLYIKGHTTDFKEKVTSMQIDRVPIKKAKKGDDIGLLVKRRVRIGDIVYKI